MISINEFCEDPRKHVFCQRRDNDPTCALCGYFQIDHAGITLSPGYVVYGIPTWILDPADDGPEVDIIRGGMMRIAQALKTHQANKRNAR